MLIEDILSCTDPVDMEAIVTVQPMKCTDFDHLINIYKDDLTVTQSFQDCLSLCLAIHVATNLDGEPLWAYLIGPPSSGKSVICEMISADEVYSKPISKLTGLISGAGKHPVLHMLGKCCVVKDGTLMLEMPESQRMSLYGDLRDIYDGSLEAYYKNGVEAHFNNASFGLLIGVTEAIYSHNMSSLGERFLHCRLENSRDVEVSRNRKAIASVFGQTSFINKEDNSNDTRSFTKQKAYTVGLLHHIHTKMRNEAGNGTMLRPEANDEVVSLIQALADVVVCSRASAPVDLKSDDILVECNPEATTRVVKQLSKTAYALCNLFNTSNIDKRISRLITKLGVDTAYGKQYQLLRQIALKKITNRSDLASIPEVGMSLPTVSRLCAKLESLKIVIPDGKGRPRYRCVDWLEDSLLRVEKYKEAL